MEYWHTFKKAWEETLSNSQYILIYEYNTSWINEDYTHTLHHAFNHQAGVSNDNGGDGSAITSPNKWAKMEVRHAGTTILYGINYFY